MSRVWVDRRWTAMDPLVSAASAPREARPGEDRAVVVRKNRTGFEIVAPGHYRRGEYEIVLRNYRWTIHRSGRELGRAWTLHDAQVEVRRRTLHPDGDQEVKSV